ncbi:flagellar basal-body MS-ring/collar protein FliF [Massilia sp. TSP1-1-2]|uniref:flagellar basal-body MS-ring/collar protein FliF n=1 Tax=Massilia sp. TSP1-1-2 TaxID=2804649 RepID=UPI003CE678C3
MAHFIDMWTGLGRGARTGLVAGSVAIVSVMIALGVWAYHPEHQILFADLAPRDAGAMTAELDKMKVPYSLGENGTAILVPREMVYKTRLALMGKEVPLHGAVGFEVFNNADFGMTEFVQKVNYLRAIQGELTRTILAIDGVQNARVHLAIPENGLFKKSVTKPKASVTLTMKNGQAMSEAQVAGIQRLVAASVTDIASGDVTVLDQHGVALTRVQGDEESGAGSVDASSAGSAQLDAKRSTEEYMVKKVTAVLDRTFGPGQAIASVDIVLNLDRARLTTEEVIPAKGKAPEGAPTGVTVRERQSMREDAAPAGKQASATVTTSESDYQVGRRVEQTSVAAGTVRRMTVSVVVKQALTDAQLAKLREVVGLALGFNAQRGDAIVVNSMDRLVSAIASPALPTPDLPNAAPATVPAAAVSIASAGTRSVADRASAEVVVWILAALVTLIALAVLVHALLRRRAPAPVLLSVEQREKVLQDVRRWVSAQGVDDAVTGVPK